MPEVKLLAAVCFVVSVLCGLTSSVALAGNWDVNGTVLNGTAALGNALVLAHGGFSVSLAGVEIQCTSSESEINGGELISPDWVEAASVVFKECIVSGSGGCSTPTELLGTSVVHGLAELDGSSNTRILILPLPSKSFGAIRFEGETCALLGEQPVTGKASILIDDGAVARATQLALISGSGLKVGSDEATLSGADVDLKLASGQTWNFL